VGIPPLTDVDVRDMVRSLRTYPLLQGYRGGPKVDADAYEGAIHRVAALAVSHPEVVEMDCNPILLSRSGATVTDCRVRVGSPTADPNPGGSTGPIG
jgi:hypothetical protein